MSSSALDVKQTLLSGILRRSWVVASVASGLTFLLCYLRNFAVPYVPIMAWNDQLLYATNGYRMIAGQMPYRDFFEFLPAGTDLVYALLFHIFGVRLWISNLLMVVLAACAVALLTLAAQKVLHGISAVLPAAFAVGFGLYGGLDATHHWFSTVATLAAMLVLLNGTRLRHVAWAGALCGVTASFTQSKGAAVTLGFVVYLVWRAMQAKDLPRARWGKPLLLCGSAMVAFLVINIHYMMALGLAEWCRWVVVFPFRYYPSMPGQTLGSPIIDLHSRAGVMKWIAAVFLYLCVPIIYVIFFSLLRRRRVKHPSQLWDQLLLISISGSAMFLAIVPSLSIMRASAVCFPATLLLAWELERAPRTLRWAGRAAATISIACAVYLVVITQRTRWNELALPAGMTAISDLRKYELYLWMKERTHPGESYLGISPLSLPLWLETPAPIQAPGPWEYYRPEHVARCIAAMEANRIPILVFRQDAQFAHTAGYKAEHLNEFHNYVWQHYRLTKRFATGDEVWERNADRPVNDTATIPDESRAEDSSTPRSIR